MKVLSLPGAIPYQSENLKNFSVFFLHRVTSNFLSVKDVIIIRKISSICMQSTDRRKKIPLFPLLAAAMILIPVLVVAGCTGQGPAGIPLNGSGWTLTEYLHNGTLVKPLAAAKVTLEFDDKGGIGGSAGCNHYFASYETKGTSVTIGQAGSTEMYCMTPGVMDQESEYLALLQNARTYSLEGDRLALSDAGGRVILRFERTVPPLPEPLVGTNWTLESFHAADTVSSVIAGTSITALFDGNGKVTGSAGCNSYFAGYQVSAASLSIDQPGSTKKYCGEPGVMQQESDYLSRLSQVRSYTITGDRLTLEDAGGQPILSFTKGASPE